MDFYSDDSDPDIDEDLREDLEALRRSCVLSGTDPDAAVAQVSSCLAAPSTPSASVSAPAKAANFSSDDDDDDDDEDLALVRSIRASLNLNKASPASPLPDAGGSSPRPICTWPPSDTEDDEEDDLETLRAIQRRFSHYHSSTSAASPETMKSEASQVVHRGLFADGPDEEFPVEKENVKAPNRTGFPKAALLLVDALKKNRAYQKFIRRKMVSIEAKIEENKDLRDRVKCLMGYQLSCRKSVGRFLCQKEDPRVRLISSRKPTTHSTKKNYRKMPALFLGPAENPHVSKYKMVLKQFPMSLQKQPWLDTEKDKLARGIKQQYQETLILDSMNNGSAIGDFSAVDMAYALTNGAGNFEVTPESLRTVMPLINWDKIAAMYLPGRSGAECQSRWLNCDDPLINRNAWTAQEETRLLQIIQEKGMCNWINIAVSLGTHRTPFHCLARYQRSLNPHILNKAWTKEEDLQLQAAVETFGRNWQLVSASLDGRMGNQCSNRWRKTLHPDRTRVGRWSIDEDKRLMVSVTIFGSGSWSRIAQFIPGRTQSQCSERWRNVLDPDIDHGEWRPEEDSKLLAAVSELGPCWAKISKLIPHRTDNLCYRRWHKLCKHQLSSVKAVRQIKKNIFQSNFVDRENERPAIGPADLIPLVHSKGDGCDENIQRDRSENQNEENQLASVGPSNPSRCRSSSRKKKSTTDNNNEVVQNEENVIVSVDPSNSSRGHNRPKKRKSTTDNSNEAVQNEESAIVSYLSNSSRGHSRSRTRKYTTDDNNEAVQNEESAVVSVGPINSSSNRSRPRKSKTTTDNNNEAVQKKMRGSIPFSNEAVPEELRGTISTDNEVGTNRMTDPVSVGEERAPKKKMRASRSVCNDEVLKGRVRVSMGIDNEAGNRMTDPVSVGEEGVGTDRITDHISVGEEGVPKKRTRASRSNGNEGVVTKRTRGSNSVGNEGVVRKRMRASISAADEGIVKRRVRGSAFAAKKGAATKRKRASPSRKSAEDNSIPDSAGNAVPELAVAIVPSEERVVDAGIVNKGRGKSTPRPRQINMPEEVANKHSTCVRLANCLSFARMNRTNRNKS